MNLEKFSSKINSSQDKFNIPFKDRDISTKETHFFNDNFFYKSLSKNPYPNIQNYQFKDLDRIEKTEVKRHLFLFCEYFPENIIEKNQQEEEQNEVYFWRNTSLLSSNAREKIPPLAKLYTSFVISPKIIQFTTYATEERLNSFILRQSRSRYDRKFFHYIGPFLSLERDIETNKQNLFISISKKVPGGQLEKANFSDFIKNSGETSVFILDCDRAGLAMPFIQQHYDKGNDILCYCSCSDTEKVPRGRQVPRDIFSMTMLFPSITMIACHSQFYRSFDIKELKPIDSIFNGTEEFDQDKLNLLNVLRIEVCAIIRAMAFRNLPRFLYLQLFNKDITISSLTMNFIIALKFLKPFGIMPIMFPAIPDLSDCEEWSIIEMRIEAAIFQLFSKRLNTHLSSDAFIEMGVQTMKEYTELQMPLETIVEALPFLSISVHKQNMDSIKLLCEFLEQSNENCELCLCFPFLEHFILSFNKSNFDFNKYSMICLIKFLYLSKNARKRFIKSSQSFTFDKMLNFQDIEKIDEYDDYDDDWEIGKETIKPYTFKKIPNVNQKDEMNQKQIKEKTTVTKQNNNSSVYLKDEENKRILSLMFSSLLAEENPQIFRHLFSKNTLPFDLSKLTDKVYIWALLFIRNIGNLLLTLPTTLKLIDNMKESSKNRSTEIKTLTIYALAGFLKSNLKEACSPLLSRTRSSSNWFDVTEIPVKSMRAALLLRASFSHIVRIELLFMVSRFWVSFGEKERTPEEESLFHDISTFVKNSLDDPHPTVREITQKIIEENQNSSNAIDSTPLFKLYSTILSKNIESYLNENIPSNDDSPKKEISNIQRTTSSSTIENLQKIKISIPIQNLKFTETVTLSSRISTACVVSDNTNNIVYGDDDGYLNINPFNKNIIQRIKVSEAPITSVSCQNMNCCLTDRQGSIFLFQKDSLIEAFRSPLKNSTGSNLRFLCDIDWKNSLVVSSFKGSPLIATVDLVKDKRLNDICPQRCQVIEDMHISKRYEKLLSLCGCDCFEIFDMRDNKTAIAVPFEHERTLFSGVINQSIPAFAVCCDNSVSFIDCRNPIPQNKCHFSKLPLSFTTSEESCCAGIGFSSGVMIYSTTTRPFNLPPMVTGFARTMPINCTALAFSRDRFSLKVIHNNINLIRADPPKKY